MPATGVWGAGAEGEAPHSAVEGAGQRLPGRLPCLGGLFCFLPWFGEFFGVLAITVQFLSKVYVFSDGCRVGIGVFMPPVSDSSWDIFQQWKWFLIQNNNYFGENDLTKLGKS